MAQRSSRLTNLGTLIRLRWRRIVYLLMGAALVIVVGLYFVHFAPALASFIHIGMAVLLLFVFARLLLELLPRGADRRTDDRRQHERRDHDAADDSRTGTD